MLPHPQARRRGGAEYVANGEMPAATVAWPVRYDASGVMTFIVNQEGNAYEKELGPETPSVERVTPIDPDTTWRRVPPSDQGRQKPWSAS